MDASVTRLLAIGDLHLGRTPARLPPDLGGRAAEAVRLGPVTAWRRAVEAAVAHRVEAVVLLGDVVEDADDRFAAYGELRHGLVTLLEAGIQVVAVAGNHDHLALPRLARALGSGLRLLGEGGRWERHPVGANLTLVGWSFPGRHHPHDPLAGFTHAPASGRATLGLLHADLDAPAGSPYAPVRRAALEATGLDGWLLGHVHRPDALAGPRPLGYLGSLCPLDPGEPGAHGAWLVEVAGPGRVQATLLPLAPVRYEVVPLAAPELPGADADAVAQALQDALHAALAERQALLGPGAPEAVGVRVRLEGAAADLATLSQAGRQLEGHAIPHEGRWYFVEAVHNHARVAVSLAALAAQPHPAGLLARRILTLEAGGEAARALVARARPHLEREAVRGGLADAGPPKLSEARVQALLLQAAHQALSRLLAGREAPP